MTATSTTPSRSAGEASSGGSECKLLLLGMDAAEPELVEEGIREGWLPHLARLRERGAYGRLSSCARWLVGSPWPTFYTGTGPQEHALYHYLTWDAERMESVRPTPERHPIQPFWRPLATVGHRVVAIDVPLVFPASPAPPSGCCEVHCWATHDRFVPTCSYPPELLRRLETRFGPPPIGEEDHRVLDVAGLLRLRDDLVHATRKAGDLGLELMRTETWDVFVQVFAATHRGGHKLWLEPAAPSRGSDPHGELPQALRRLYEEEDRQVGRLVEAAGPDATVMVFSLHGMGPNFCHTPALGEMVRRVIGDGAGSGGLSPMDWLRRAREAVPVSLRTAVKGKLPSALRDRLTAFWPTAGVRWEETPAFCPVADLQGYVRINLAGRERSGIVAPGAEYDALCARLAAGLVTFLDADTGEPVVREVVRIEDVLPPGTRRDQLPDLLVTWNEKPVAARRALRSERFGTVRLPGGIGADGRPGNHRGEGFLVAAGRPFEPGGEIVGADILDLAPTVCALLGRAPAEAMEGRSLVSNAPVATGARAARGR